MKSNADYDVERLKQLTKNYFAERILANHSNYETFKVATVELQHFTETVGFNLMEDGVIPEEYPSLLCCGVKAARKTPVHTQMQRFVCRKCGKTIKVHPVQYLNALVAKDLKIISTWEQLNGGKDACNV